MDKVISKETPKWHDDDDKNIKINLNSKNKLKKLKQTPTETTITAEEYQKRIQHQYKTMNSYTDLFKWAEQTEENSKVAEGDLDSLMQTNKPIFNESKLLTQSNLLSITQLTPLTKQTGPHSSIITTLNFHPTNANIAITTGLDKKLKIYSIKESENQSDLITSLNTLDMPIFSTHFISENELIISGRRKHYFTYDLIKKTMTRYEGHFATSANDISSLEKCYMGNDAYAFGDQRGNVYIYNKNTKRFKYDIKLSGEVNSICFDHNGIHLYIASAMGEVYIFDLRKYRNCVNKFTDSGNFNINCMDISNDNTFISTGGKSGYVNIYKIDDIKNCPSYTENVEPIKTFDNLTTSCDFVRFNRSSDILGISSKWKKNAFRLINLKTMKVYANFPSFKDRMKYPMCFDFNCNGEYLAIGNDEGKAFLYKIDTH